MKNEILNSLSAQGHRITIARKKIIELFVNNELPLTAAQIFKLFNKKGIKIHRATVYREIDFLISHNFIHSLNLGRGATSYELNKLHHCHHFVCKKCDNIINVFPNIVERELKKFETLIMKKQKVHIDRHSLKFFGLCNKCNKKQHVKN